MKKITLFIFAITLFISPTIGHAQGCAEKATSLALELGGEVVGVENVGQDCKVKIRIPGKNGQPPRVETKTVNK